MSNLQNNSNNNNSQNNHSINNHNSRDNYGNSSVRFHSQKNHGGEEISGIPVLVPKNNSRHSPGFITPGIASKNISNNYGNNHGNSGISVLPIALTNSDRTTVSQMRALRRIQLQSNQKANDEQPRRIFNYARGLSGGNDQEEEEEAEEEKGY